MPRYHPSPDIDDYRLRTCACCGNEFVPIYDAEECCGRECQTLLDIEDENWEAFLWQDMEEKGAFSEDQGF